MAEEERLSIGEVAARAGVRPSSIRHYEAVGVLPEPERVSGQRRYGPEVLRSLAVVAVAKHAGFSLAEIGRLLTDRGAASQSERLRQLARHKLPEAEAQVSRAEARRAWLEIASRCDCEDFDACALFSAG